MTIKPFIMAPLQCFQLTLKNVLMAHNELSFDFECRDCSIAV